MERNYCIAARVWLGELSSVGYEARIRAGERALQVRRARTHSMSRSELTADDLERIRAELPAKIASLRKK